METVLICVSPDISQFDYELLETQLKSRGWDARMADVSTLTPDETLGAATVVYAADWPEANLAAWLARARSALGPRRRLLAILPQPPASYPKDVQAAWTRAVGYGSKISELIEIVDGFLAGRT